MGRLPAVFSLPLWAVLLLAWVAIPTALAQSAPPPPKIKIAGRIQGAPSGANIETARVVLIRFTLDARNRIQERKIEEVSPGKDGRFGFKPVTGVAKGMYRIIATLGDHRTGTKLFPLAKPGESKSFELRFPRLIEDRSALRIQEARIAFEPSSGGAFVTEVVLYNNPTKNIMEGVKTPLEVSIPAEAESLEMIYTANQKENHRREGSKVLVYSNLPPGRTTVAFRYRLAAGWGSISLEKRYGVPVANLFILSPEGMLTLRGEGFVRGEIRTFQKTRFDSRVRKGIGAGQSVTLTLSGLPIRQNVVLPWIGVFLAIMTGVVVWYWRNRLPREEKAESVNPAEG